MKWSKLILIILFSNSILQFLVPYWWLLSLICFASCWLLACSSRHAFVSGFVGIALSYLAMMLVQDFPTGFILSTKMSAVFSSPGPIGFYLISILIGGILGGLSGLCGFVGKNFLRSTKYPA